MVYDILRSFLRCHQHQVTKSHSALFAICRSPACLVTMEDQRSVPALADVKVLVQSFASDFFAGGVASGFTKSAMAPVER